MNEIKHIQSQVAGRVLASGCLGLSQDSLFPDQFFHIQPLSTLKNKVKCDVKCKKGLSTGDSGTGHEWFPLLRLDLLFHLLILRNDLFLYFSSFFLRNLCWRWLGRGACLLSRFSCVWLCGTLWTVAHQAPVSMGFPRQAYWSGLPCSPPGDLPDLGIEPAPFMSPALAGRLFTNSTIKEALVKVGKLFAFSLWNRAVVLLSITVAAVAATIIMKSKLVLHVANTVLNSVY